MVSSLLTKDDEVVFHSEYRSVRNTGHFEDGTVGTCVVVHQRVVRESDVPLGIAFIFISIAQLLLDEGRERTIVEGVFDGLEVCQHIGLSIVAGTVNPAVATCTVAIVATVVEHIVLDEHVVPALVVRSLLTYKAADDALEGTILHNQRVEGHSHTVTEHVEEVVTCGITDTCFLVTVVETFGVVEVDIVEGQFLHVDFATLTSFR